MVNNSTNTVATTVHTFITSAPESWIDSILNRIPLPRWAIYALAGVAAFLILLIFICCLCCCCRRNSKQKKKEKISLRDAPATVTTSLVQPDLEGLVKAERNEYRGRLQYSLEYNFQKEEITVLVKQAASLKAMDSGGTSDPYVIVYLTNDTRKKHETKVYRKTLNPVFNESFSFQIPQSDIAETAVVLQVFDFNRFSKHDVIGEVRLPLGEVELQHVIEEWKELKPASKMEQERLGEICFSLRYVPSTSKLTVVILEAKKLKKMDSDGFSDPYVKVHLALNKKKWKRKKTTVKKNTLSPYFNEAFTFDVSLQQMQVLILKGTMFALLCCSLREASMQGTPESTGSNSYINIDLIISVWDHDKVNKNKQIGKLFLGCRASGNALRHWSDMLAHPRRPMAQWHNLQPAEEVDKTLGLKTKLKIPLPNS